MSILLGEVHSLRLPDARKLAPVCAALRGDEVQLVRIDYEYLSGILNRFLDSDSPVLYLSSFRKELDEDANKLFFHLLILRDKAIVSGSGSPGQGIGIEFNDNTNEYDYWLVALRLTAEGHDFADAITKPNIKELVIDKFRNEGISAVVDLSKRIALKQAERKLDDLRKV